MYEEANEGSKQFSFGVMMLMSVEKKRTGGKSRAGGRREFTVADLRQVKLGEVPPLQPVGGVSDVASHCGLSVTDGRT